MNVVGFARILGLEATLREQHGVIRRDQALAAGLTRHRVDDLVRRGRWIRVMPRVFAVENMLAGRAHTPDPVPFLRLPPRARIRAGWLWAGEDSVIAREAAAWWLGLSPDPPTTVTVLVPPTRRLTTHPGVRVVRSSPDRREIREDNWIRVTSPARTCLDLARSAVPDRLEAALRRRKVDRAGLERSLERSRGRRGQVRARTAVEEVATNPWSVSERAAHRALTESGVTGWVANPRMRLASGKRHPDIAFEDIMLAVEIDGRATHDTAAAFDYDRVRHNEFVQAGWTVLHFTNTTVLRDPTTFVAVIKATVAKLRGGVE